MGWAAWRAVSSSGSRRRRFIPRLSGFRLGEWTPKPLFGLLVGEAGAYHFALGRGLLSEWNSAQILTIAIVAAFSVYFFVANRQQSRGKKVIENTVSRRLSVIILSPGMLIALSGGL